MLELEKDFTLLVEKHKIGNSCGIPPHILVKMLVTTLGVYINTMNEIKDYYDALDNEKAHQIAE